MKEQTDGMRGGALGERWRAERRDWMEDLS